MHVIKGFFIAISTYSKLPVGGFEWKEEDMRYALIFFPWVGALTGLLCAGWHLLCDRAGIGSICEVLVMTAIPLLITGGIHVDGYMDTMDAVHVYGTYEKRREILSDPHIGAFSVIMLMLYGLIFVGALAEVIQRNALPAVYACFYFSRVLSGLSVLWFPKAKEGGMLFTFCSGAAKKITTVCLILQGLFCIVFWLWEAPLTGGAAALAGLIVMGWYYRFSRDKFGGVSGDTAGFFLLMEELFMILAICVVSVTLTYCK